MPASFASVTVSSPAPGTTVQSPVQFVGTATSNNPITGWNVYDGWNLAYQNANSQMNTAIALAAGAHTMTVKAWDAAGNAQVTVFELQVTGGGTGLTISSPANGATVQSPVSFVATATSNNPITGWTVYDGWNLAYKNNSSQLNASIALAAGAHVMTIKAWDAAGNVQFKILQIQVGSGGGGGGGSVTITSPANGSTVQSPVSFVATATSNNPITGWNVYDGGTLVYRNNSSQLNTSITLAAGSHSLTVKAWDAAGNAQVQMLQIVVATPAPPPITVSVSPTSTTVASGQSTQFSATVTGTSNTGVLWFVAGVQGGNGSVGTISASGVYTAPVTSTSMQETITAQSAADPS